MIMSLDWPNVESPSRQLVFFLWYPMRMMIIMLKGRGHDNGVDVLYILGYILRSVKQLLIGIPERTQN